MKIIYDRDAKQFRLQHGADVIDVVTKEDAMLELGVNGVSNILRDKIAEQPANVRNKP